MQRHLPIKLQTVLTQRIILPQHKIAQILLQILQMGKVIAALQPIKLIQQLSVVIPPVIVIKHPQLIVLTLPVVTMQLCFKIIL